MDRAELLSLVGSAMGELSESDQQTLLDAYWEEDTTEARSPTFRKRKERALERLRIVLRRIYGLD
jgi:hypothetical protein